MADPVLAAAANEDIAGIFIELGALVLVLALLARLAIRFGLSPIPLYLLVGLALGEGGLMPLGFSEEFIQTGAAIGVILLLFMLGLEYSADELRTAMQTSYRSGLVDMALNFPPGFLLGVVLGWDVVAAILLGGVTYISSSGVISKVLSDLDRLGNRETPAVLIILVIEDLVMAAYLPLVAVLLLGIGWAAGLLSLSLALAAVAVALLLAMRYGQTVSRLISNRSDEVILLTVFGTILVVAGFAEGLRVSGAVGAFLVGIALSEPVAEHARALLTPLRDLFAATFFLFFGLQIDPGAIPQVAALALALGVVTAATKLVTGWRAAAALGARARGRARAGATLIARGEFSIVIAGLGVVAGVEPQLGALAAAYVLLMAVVGPVAARYADTAVTAWRRRAGDGGLLARERGGHAGRGARRRGRPGGVRGSGPGGETPDAGAIGG